MNKLIYLDNAASTPCDPRVIEEILPYFTEIYGNPANFNNPIGKSASQAVEIARGKVADLINCMPQNIIWTSGATESNNIAIQGIIKNFKKRNPFKTPHIITSLIEHKSVLESIKSLNDIEITFIKPDINGNTNIGDIEKSIKENTILISIMLANNELGVINNLEEISILCNGKNIQLHTDATQFIGKIPIDINKLKVDFLSMSGHKIYAPKGVGVLYVKDFSYLSPLYYGGGHEKGFRPGTLNVPGIVGVGKACELCNTSQIEEYNRMRNLRDKLENELTLFNNGIKINGCGATRLPNISNISFPVKKGMNIHNFLSLIACSSGSACDTPENLPSHVLENIGKNTHEAKNTIRFSLGRFTTEDEINDALNHIKTIITKNKLLI